MSAVVVIGVGYVGLTTSASLAHLGHQVVAADVNLDRIEGLRSGVMPIVEDGLGELVTAGARAGRLTFEPMAGELVAGAEFVFLCVPTPQADDGSADLSFVTAAADQIGPHLSAGSIVVNKSTVPVGSVAVVHDALGRRDVSVVSNPEFLREGRAVYDCLHPDRVVIGADDQGIARRVASLYDGLDAPVVLTDPASAETVKYACNAFLATKVSFINAVANLCDAVGADVGDVVRGMGLDRRIGSDHLAPGPGWGGSCFPKDASALLRIAEDHGYDFALLRGAIDANEDQFDRVAATIADATSRARLAPEATSSVLADARIAVWGLTFKAGTDDLRHSPALQVIARLRRQGAAVVAYDPTQPDADSEPLASLGVEVVADAYRACKDADTVVVLTEWPELAEVDFRRVAELLAPGVDGSVPTVVDTRNLLDRAVVTAAGCRYLGIGR